MKKIPAVWVRNNDTEAFSSRYDGEDFTIAPGEAIELEADCAKLVFGFGEKDKSRAIRRLGWAPTSAEFSDALERLGRFSFHMERSEAAEYQASSSAPAGTDAAGDSSDDPAAAARVEQLASDADLEVRNQPLPKKKTNVVDKLARMNAG